jgi:hypothetical protein
MGMVDGLWAGGSEAATDFALIAYEVRLLGYNAIRLPFTWSDLEAAPRTLDKECTPISAEALKRRLISPHVLGQYASKALPGNASPQRKPKAGYCNQYLPRSSNYHRLLFVAQSFIAQGMYVVLDYQPMVGGGCGGREGAGGGSECKGAAVGWIAAECARSAQDGRRRGGRMDLVPHTCLALPPPARPAPQGLENHPYDQAAFVSGWAKLWQMLACLPNFQQDIANRVFVDVMNEPDSMSIVWEERGGRPGARQLYLGTADRLWSLTPDSVLFMFEGAPAPPQAARRMEGPRGAGATGPSPGPAVRPWWACPDPRPAGRPTDRHWPERVRPQLGQRLHYRRRAHQQPGAVGCGALLPRAADQAVRQQGGVAAGPAAWGLRCWCAAAAPATPAQLEGPSTRRGHTPPTQSVMTPHVYPPSITKATFIGTALWDQCRTSFGYLQTRGFCPGNGGGCHRFPVLIGEVGSAFETEEDKTWLHDFADFMNAEVWGAALGGRGRA